MERFICPDDTLVDGFVDELTDGLAQKRRPISRFYQDARGQGLARVLYQGAIAAAAPEVGIALAVDQQGAVFGQVRGPPVFCIPARPRGALSGLISTELGATVRSFSAASGSKDR